MCFINFLVHKFQIAAALPVQHAQKTELAQYVRYTPSQQSGLNAGGAQQRIIRLVTDQVDPMEPPRFKYILIIITYFEI